MLNAEAASPHARLVTTAAPPAVILAASAYLLIRETGADIAAKPPLLPLLLAAAAAAATAPALRRQAGDAAWQSRSLCIAALLASAALLTLHILLRVPRLGMAGDYGGVFLAWLLAVALYFLVLARAAPRLAPSAPLHPFHSRAASLTLGACVAGAALLRLWQLGSVPYIFQGDEGSFGLWAGGLSFSPMSNPFTVGWMSQPTLGMFLETSSLKLLGADATSARLPWTLLSILTIPVAFLLAARLRGTAVGLVTAALLATYHFHIHYGRVALNNIADPLFMSLALLWLVQAIERKRLLAWALAGGACGLALYFYQGARLTPVVACTVVAFACFRLDREARRGMPAGVAAATGAFFVVAAPMLQFAVLDPDTFNSRIRQISIFQPGWLSNETLVTGQSVSAILWNQTLHAVGAFNVYADTSEHFHLRTPLLDPLFGLLFLAGLFYATYKVLFSRRDWALATMVVWWWSGTVIGGALTFGPPASQRLVTLTVPVCFFIALSLHHLAAVLRRVLSVPLAASQTLGTLLFAVISLKTYFLDFIPLQLSGGASAALMMELMPELKTLAPEDSVVFAGPPQVYWGFPTRAFLLPETRGRDAFEPFSAPPPPETVAKGTTVLFVFVPDRTKELSYIQQTFPEGVISRLLSPVDGHVMATLYRVAG